MRGAFAEQLAHLQERALSTVVSQLSQPKAHHSFADSAARCARAPLLLSLGSISCSGMGFNV
jgi:hypothetical protein